MVSKTKAAKNGPLIIGGGIRTSRAANEIYNAGADIIIVGNGAEENQNLINEIAEIKNKLNSSSHITISLI